MRLPMDDCVRERGEDAMKNKAVLIVNPSSGKEQAKANEEEAVKELKKVYEEVEVKETKGAGDAEGFAKEASLEEVSLVVSMGGDGTVHEVVNGLSDHKVRPALGIIPLGTVNDLARALKIPLDPEEAVKVLSGGIKRSIDVAKAGDRYFASGFALGRVPESIHQVTPDEKSKLGPLAYLLAGLKKLMEKEKIQLKIDSREEVFQGELTAVVGSLSGSLGGFEGIFPEATLEDGKLHVLLIEDLSLLDTAKILPDFLKGDVASSDHLTYFSTRKMKVAPLGEEHYESDLDGEKGPKVPFTVEVLEGHLKVLVPDVEKS